MTTWMLWPPLLKLWVIINTHTHTHTHTHPRVHIQDQCDLNARTNMGQTALHLAVHQGHARIVERLVGYGVNLNVQDNDGDTALHTALVRETVDSLTPETPQLKKVSVVKCSLHISHDIVWIITVQLKFIGICEHSKKISHGKMWGQFCCKVQVHCKTSC